MTAARPEIALPIYDPKSGSLRKGARSWAGAAKSAAAGAPYLEGLIGKWPNIVKALESVSPENIFQNILSEMEPGDTTELPRRLRMAKQKIHLLTGLCDVAQVWDWEQVTEALSAFADACMELLIKAIAADMGFVSCNKRGPIPGLFVMALGKYGGRELNYSSDIDLIVFYDPSALKLPPALTSANRAERTLVRFVRKLMRGFDETSEEGYVFRTDLRLRPDPRANTVAVSTLTAERYYETLGQNWERAAMIKARFCGGDAVAADEFSASVLTPFIWRRSLDYAAIADIHSIKRQIQAGMNVDDFAAPGHDLKLGVGGIREIEFFASIQQLILGGRQKTLRTPRTVDALQALADGGYVAHSIVKTLIEDYAVLRGLEHRVQMYADEQTHDWPASQAQRQQLVSLCGLDDYLSYEQNMAAVFSRVHTAYSDLFSEEEDLSASKGSLVFTGVAPETVTMKTLSGYGYRRGTEVWKHMADWLGGRIRATRSPRARELLTRLAPRLIEVCAETGAPDEAFFGFAAFMANLNAGVTMLSLLVEKPRALNELVNLLALAPPLAQTLSQRPSLIDAMIEPGFARPEGVSKLIDYGGLIPQEADFEASMNIVRRHVHEDQLSLIAAMLRQKTTLGCGGAFSAMASGAITALLPQALKETERQYGNITGEFAVLALGKLAGREMTLSSDIDIMLIYDDGASSAEKNSALYNKLTKRLVTALSSITQEGRLYEVDMALRPSGRSGPLAVSIRAFEKYYRENAWTWEFMALSRARITAHCGKNIGENVAGIIRDVFSDKDYQGNLRADILDMHGRLRREKPPSHIWDIKNIEGGLRDIEFISQYLMLKFKPIDMPHSTVNMLQCAQDRGYAKDGQIDLLLSALSFYEIVLQIFAVTVDNKFDPVAASGPLKNLLSQAVGQQTFTEVERMLAAHMRAVSSIFKDAFKLNV